VTAATNRENPASEIKELINLSPDTEKHLKIVITIFYIIIGLAFAYILLAGVIPFLMPFVLAFVFFLILSPVVDLVQQRLRLPRNLACILTILLTAGILVALLVIIGTEVYSIAEGVVADFMSGSGYDGLIYLSDRINEIFGAKVDLAGSFKNLIMPVLSGAINLIKPIAAGAPQVFVSVIMFILTTYFLISDKDKIKDFFNKATKNKLSALTAGFKKVSKKSILKYLRAQMIIMLITLTELIIAFTIIEWIGILDLKHTFVIVFGIAILDALPVFGTGAVLIPWSIYGIVVGNFPLAIAMLAIYIICLTVRQLIEPKIVGESLGMHPLITLLSMYIGLKTIGITGMVLLPIFSVLVIQLIKMGVFSGITNPDSLSDKTHEEQK